MPSPGGGRNWPVAGDGGLCYGAPAMNEPSTPTSPHPRAARLNRWRRPLSGWRERLWAWADMIFLDHGFLRWVYLNLHRISPRAWRAAQPSPGQIGRLARRGIRTVVNLRGGQSYGSLPLEIEACARHGVAFETFVLRSRAVPAPEDILAAKALFERIEYPVLFHCKSGADRAGMMSALFVALAEGRPAAEARRQLSWRYGHVSSGKTGVLDALFDAYAADNPAEEQSFLEWSQTRYDRDAVMTGYVSRGWGNFLTEMLLRRE